MVLMFGMTLKTSLSEAFLREQTSESRIQIIWKVDYFATLYPDGSGPKMIFFLNSL